MTRDSDGMQAASKIIKKPKDLKKKEMVANEHKILTSIDHPHCVKCYDAYETDDRLYLFMELMPGGELFDTIVERGHFTEQDTQKVTYKLLVKLLILHSLLEHLLNKQWLKRPRKVVLTNLWLEDQH